LHKYSKTMYDEEVKKNKKKKQKKAMITKMRMMTLIICREMELVDKTV